MNKYNKKIKIIVIFIAFLSCYILEITIPKCNNLSKLSIQSMNLQLHFSKKAIVKMPIFNLVNRNLVVSMF
jgi:hypothetical protein